MSQEERAIEGLRVRFEEERVRATLKPGSATVNLLNDLFKQAAAWPAGPARQLADLAEKIFGHSAVGWGSGEKKRERKGKITALRNTTSTEERSEP